MGRGGVTMTVFVNPSAASNGAGTLIDPRNTWTGVDWSSDNDFAQIAEFPLVSTALTAINPTVSGTATNKKTLRSYDPLTGDPTTKKAVIVGGNSSSRNGIGFADNVAYWNVRHFDISDVGEFNVNSHGITSSINPANNAQASFITIENCRIHDLRNVDAASNIRALGINLRGRGNIVRNNELFRIPIDAIFFHGQDILIEGNKIWDTNWFPNIPAADCIQGANDISGAVIKNNYLDGKKNEGKQTVILQNTNPTRSIIQFYGNTVIGGSSSVQNLYTDAPTVIWNNYFVDGLFSIRTTASCVITGNIFNNFNSLAQHFAVWSEGGDCIIVNNTFKNFTNASLETSNRAIFASNGTPANLIQNNAIDGYYSGIGMDTAGGHTETYNWIANTVVPIRNSGGNSHALGPGSATTSWIQYTSAFGNLIIPENTDLENLSSKNPIALSGLFVEGIKLFNSRLRPGFVPVGAFQAVLPKGTKT